MCSVLHGVVQSWGEKGQVRDWWQQWRLGIGGVRGQAQGLPLRWCFGN